MGHIWGFPQKCQNRQKLPKIYIRPEVTHIETTTGGGQQDLKEHPRTDFELPGRDIPLWSKSIFDRYRCDFSKNRLWARSGHGTAWGGCDGDDDIGLHR